MREILFKAKRLDNGEWVEGYYLNIAKINPFICTGKIKLDGAVKGIIALEMYEIDPGTLCQYVGLTDENGQKIYENDIVAFLDTVSTENGYSEVSCVGAVSWDGTTASFQVSNRTMEESYEVLDEGCTVIGSIFDNPELMEVE